MAPEHYFTARPDDSGPAAQRRIVQVRLADRDLDVVTAGGVFSGDGLDLGTRVLLRSVPDPPAVGDLLDLGCGWGPVALTLALRAPEATVWAVDVNARARELTTENAARLGLRNLRVAAPDGVPAEVRFAAIWSNPPIRIGKPALHDLLRTWLARLAPGASAHLVVQRNLGADSLHAWLAGELAGELADDEDGDRDGEPAPTTVERLQVTRAASAKGFRVLAVTRPPTRSTKVQPAAGDSVQG